MGQSSNDRYSPQLHGRIDGEAVRAIQWLVDKLYALMGKSEALTVEISKAATKADLAKLPDQIRQSLQVGGATPLSIHGLLGTPAVLPGEYETPSGTMNGVNKVFTLKKMPTGSGILTLNGVVQVNYTLQGNTINMNVAPKATDAGYFKYRYMQ